MELQNYFPRDDIKKQAMGVAKFIADEVLPDERDEAFFSLYNEVKKLLAKKGDSYSIHFTCSELTEKLVESTQSGRHIVLIKDSVSSKLFAHN